MPSTTRVSLVTASARGVLRTQGSTARASNRGSRGWGGMAWAGSDRECLFLAMSSNVLPFPRAARPRNGPGRERLTSGHHTASE